MEPPLSGLPISNSIFSSSSASPQFVCKVCSLVISDPSNCINCSGQCKGRFHTACLRLSKVDADIFLTIGSGFYRCIDCNNMSELVLTNITSDNLVSNNFLGDNKFEMDKLIACTDSRIDGYNNLKNFDVDEFDNNENVLSNVDADTFPNNTEAINNFIDNICDSVCNSMSEVILEDNISDNLVSSNVFGDSEFEMVKLTDCMDGRTYGNNNIGISDVNEFDNNIGLSNINVDLSPNSVVDIENFIDNIISDSSNFSFERILSLRPSFVYNLIIKMSHRCKNSSSLTRDKHTNTKDFSTQCKLSSSVCPDQIFNSSIARDQSSTTGDSNIDNSSSSYCPGVNGENIKLNNCVPEGTLVNEKIGFHNKIDSDSMFNKLSTSRFKNRYFYNSSWLEKNSIDNCFSDSRFFSQKKLKSQSVSFIKRRYNRDSLPLKSIKPKIHNYPGVVPRFIPAHRLYSHNFQKSFSYGKGHFRYSSLYSNKNGNISDFSVDKKLNMSARLNKSNFTRFLADSYSNINVNYNRYFLSNMPVNLNSNDVKLFLENSLQTNIVCYKINLNNSKSSCFYISAPVHKHNELISPNLWPCGASISFFYGSLASSLRFD